MLLLQQPEWTKVDAIIVLIPVSPAHAHVLPDQDQGLGHRLVDEHGPVGPRVVLDRHSAGVCSIMLEKSIFYLTNYDLLRMSSIKIKGSLDGSAISQGTVLPTWQSGWGKNNNWEVFQAPGWRAFSLPFVIQSQTGCALHSNLLPKAELCSPQNHYIPAFGII